MIAGSSWKTAQLFPLKDEVRGQVPVNRYIMCDIDPKRNLFAYQNVGFSAFEDLSVATTGYLGI